MNLRDKLIIIIIIIIFISSIAFIKGKQFQKKQDKLIEQTQQFKIQNEIIKEKRIVQHRQNKNIAIDIDSDLDWLRSNCCPDCKN